MYQELEEVNAWNVTLWSIMVKCYCMKWLIKVCFLTGGAEIVNVKGSDKDWYLTNRKKYTDTESCHL